MSYTITAAQYGNSDNTTAIITTTEAGGVAISDVDTPDDWADFQAWITGGGVPDAYAAPPLRLDALTFYQELVRQDLYTDFMTWLATQDDDVKVYFDKSPSFLDNDTKVIDAMTALSTTAGAFYAAAFA